MKTLRVLGIGNILMGDDGVGPAFTDWFRRRHRFDESVEVLDLGTPGFDLSQYLAKARAVIIVDALRAEGSSGVVRSYRGKDLSAAAVDPGLSAHDPGLISALQRLKLIDSGPESVLVLGVIPKKVEACLELSPEMIDTFPHVEKLVLDELERLGATPVDG